MANERRYAAHYALEHVAKAGQDRISAARVALIGLGGLGCPLAQYLAGSGVGELLICDFDTVSESNLARQLLYKPEDVGRRKTDVANEFLEQLNPQIKIIPHNTRVDLQYLEEGRFGVGGHRHLCVPSARGALECVAARSEQLIGRVHACQEVDQSKEHLVVATCA